VPKDLKLAGKSETFSVTVRYDTQDLYGKVEASRKIVLASGDANEDRRKR
jgi:hypothetical protein